MYVIRSFISTPELSKYVSSFLPYIDRQTYHAFYSSICTLQQFAFYFVRLYPCDFIQIIQNK